jgi:predicted dehydrogenase/aryl-alcohol dehydrogenase-like predicted oxidoreductase
MVERVRWGILSTGAIAHRFATELADSQTGRAIAVASRSADTAEAFGDAHGIDRRHSTYQSLLDDSEVDAVYIAPPHPQHAEWAIRAAEAGKHILCEKPLALNYAEAEAVVEAARRHDVFLMEAFMYRCHPQTRRLVELLREGAIGDVRVVEAVHSFKGSSDPAGRLLANELGGGGILDVGCYCMSGARLVVGASQGVAFADPTDISGAAHIGASRVDEWAVASLAFEGGIVAHLATGVQVYQPPVLIVHGDLGSITVPAPWLPGVDGARMTEILVHRAGAPLERVAVEAERGLYANEADQVGACIRAGKRESSAMSSADTLGNMASLDRWRATVGVVYDSELPTALTSSVHRRPLAVRSGPIPMPMNEIDGVGRSVSRLVLGTMLAEGDPTWPMAMAVFDEFFERGGNAFDTARRYGNGESDRALGHWIASRGVRDQTVVIAKGAHTPHCDPESLTRELLTSLEDLRTDWADVYFLHRDNEDVPVGEFVDVLNEHHRAGRVRAFGGSNWTTRRVDEANEYAAAHGLRGFTALSNQFSLARMVEPTFPGCLAASDEESREWLARTDTALVAWSSQAAGFFAGGDGMGLQHAWGDPGNDERRARVLELAAARLSTPMTVALAWVLRQPLRIFPIIGPRRLAELRTSLEALTLDLTDAELAWLDLRRDES